MIIIYIDNYCQFASSCGRNQLLTRIACCGRCPFIKFFFTPTLFCSIPTYSICQLSPPPFLFSHNPRPFSPSDCMSFSPPLLSFACLLIGSRENSVPSACEKDRERAVHPQHPHLVLNAHVFINPPSSETVITSPGDGAEHQRSPVQSKAHWPVSAPKQ